MRAGKRKIEKCEPGRVFFAPVLISSRDLLPSLNGHPVMLIGSHFIHPSLPASSFSLTGRGSGVEGFSSGRPDPRPAETGIEEYDDEYFIPPASPAVSLL